MGTHRAWGSLWGQLVALAAGCVGAGSARRGLRQALALVAGTALATTWLSAEASADIYWANSYGSTIGRANNDGSNPDQVWLNSGFRPLAVTSTSGFLYWAQGRFLGRAWLNGANVMTSFLEVAPNNQWAPNSISLDLHHIYWGSYYGAKIGRANIDGSAPNTDFITNTGTIQGLSVNAQYIFWTTGGGNTIGRANLDGSGANSQFMRFRSNPGAILATRTHIYWGENGAIARANLDGSDINLQFISSAATGQAYVSGLAFDGPNLYWTDLIHGRIGRANIDGTDVRPAFITGANYPSGVTVSGAVPKTGTTGPAATGHCAIVKHPTSTRHTACVGTDLAGTHLAHADLRWATLTLADLDRANLQRADLRFAHMRQAKLQHANLKGADLGYANLERADLRGAHLQGANLSRANLCGAVMPNGSRSKQGC